MQTKQLTAIEIKPVKVPKQKKKDILGYDMFPVQYSNIFITARKKVVKAIWSIVSLKIALTDTPKYLYLRPPWIKTRCIKN